MEANERTITIHKLAIKLSVKTFNDPNPNSHISSVNFDSCASLVIFVIVPVLFCFVFEHKTL